MDFAVKKKRLTVTNLALMRVAPQVLVCTLTVFLRFNHYTGVFVKKSLY